MDSLSQLPQECLQLIFEVLARDDDTASLAALLRTNKHIATLALSSLYREPFKGTFHHNHYCIHDHGLHCRYNHPGHHHHLGHDHEQDHDHDHEHEHEHGHDHEHEHRHDHYHNHDHQHEHGHDQGHDNAEDEDMAQDDNDSKDDKDEEGKEEEKDDGQHDNDKDGDPSYHLPSRTDHALARMLLSRLPADTLPPVISLALSANKPPTSDGNTSSSTPPPLNYSAHIRNFDLPTIAMSITSYWPISRPPPTSVANYMQGDEFRQICESARLLPAYTQKIRTEEGLMQMHYEAHLYREACWALANPILEQLQSLTFPVSDLGRYSRAVDRLGHLERLHFLLDKIVDYNWDYFSDVTTEARDETKKGKDDLYQAVVQFVEDHTRLFPGHLKTVTFSDSGLWPSVGQSCPEITEREITRLLPPLHNPTHLNQDSLPHLAAHLDSTNLSYVREILDLQGPGAWYRTLRSNRQFLQRCRSLQNLFTVPLGEGAFSWAVQEKRDFESGQGAYLEDGLVPLKNVYLRESEDEQLTDELNDIAIAFSETLGSISLVMSPEPWHPSQTMNIGQGWVDLPKLTDLVISATRNRLVVDHRLFQHCPNLKNVTFTDHTSQYRWEDVVPCQPAELPNLELLRLAGMSSLTFHPDTLHSTAALALLYIEIYPDNTGRFFIPEPEELQRSFGMNCDTTATQEGPESSEVVARPLWTWDWHLPSLQHLSLSAEFAFMFQFRMLQGCPGLRSLELNMETSNRRIQRVISNSDMFLPCTNPEVPKQAMIVPSLRYLSLHGLWRIYDASLAQFLSVMFPNLESLEEQGLSGYSLKALVEVVKTKPNGIAELMLGQLPLLGEGADDAGLQSFHGGSGLVVEKYRERLVTVQVEFVQYFFLKDASAMPAKVGLQRLPSSSS